MAHKPSKKEKKLAEDLDRIDREGEFIPIKHLEDKAEVKEVILSRKKFSKEEAHAWCETHGYKHFTMQITPRYYIFPQ